MKYKDLLIESLHNDEFSLISEAETLKFCGQNCMYDFVKNFDFSITNLYYISNDDQIDPFKLTLQHNLLLFVDQLDKDKKELLDIINSVVLCSSVTSTININTQSIHLESLLKCVADMIMNDQVSSDGIMFESMCLYYQYDKILKSIVV